MFLNKMLKTLHLNLKKDSPDQYKSMNEIFVTKTISYYHKQTKNVQITFQNLVYDLVSTILHNQFTYTSNDTPKMS